MTLEGHTLGEFEILERLGQGGMGAVYKARQLSLKRLVALKTLQAAVADDEGFIARFQQEAVAAAGLSHPNLVQVYSAGESDGIHWYSMEYVEGESAKARLKREGRLDPREAIGIALHVATALQYGWRKASLIHRDVKPDNIFLSRYGEVKLGDLGLAKSAGQNAGLTTTGHSMGSPYYISPEQVQDMKNVDFRADIYSLGCTLFQMICGEPPFNGTNGAKIMLKHITEPVPKLQARWPECPQVLSEVVEKMMQKDPADRQPDYETVIGGLKQASDVVGDRKAPMVAAPGPPPQPAVAGDLEGPTVAAAEPREARPQVVNDPEAPTVAASISAPRLQVVPSAKPATEAHDEAVAVAVPVILPPEKPATRLKSKLPLLGEIISAVLVVAGLGLFFFMSKEKKAATDAPRTLATNLQSPWRDWIVENRRAGLFANQPDFADSGTEITFKQRVAANASDSFRNGKIRIRCTNPPATLPGQEVRFYIRMSPGPNGVVRRYEAFLTKNVVVFGTNDAAQNFHEITRWPQPSRVEPLPGIIVEIEAQNDWFTISLDKKKVGSIQDETIPVAGTFGVDGPAGTRLSGLSFMNLDPPETK